MLLIALTPGHTDGSTISTKMAGVILASLSSGGGELSFLGLTHFYGPFSLAAWSSGTGGAGLIGAGAYALATTTMGFSVKATLLAAACLPAVMVISFFIILPREPLKYSALSMHDSLTIDSHILDEEVEDDVLPGTMREDEGLLEGPPGSSRIVRPKPVKAASHSAWDVFRANLKRSSSLFFPLSADLYSTRFY